MVVGDDELLSWAKKMLLLVYQNQQEDFGFGVGLLVRVVDGWMMVLVTLIVLVG